MPTLPTHTFNKQYFEVLSKNKPRKNVLKAPIRALRLCILCIFAPGFLIAVPLYLRYHVYDDQVYPLGVSDMRLVDASVSTTWCQRQIIRANTSFNAYLLSDEPNTKSEPVHIGMTRALVLENDMKEYWGFYLLKGSVVSVSSCVRWPGASMVMLSGHQHLKECAYLGDNSSEEKSEQADDPKSDNVEDANKPQFMVKFKDGVNVTTANVTISDSSASDTDENKSFSGVPNFTKGNVHLSFAEDQRRRHLKKIKHNPAAKAKTPEFKYEQNEKVKPQTSSETFVEMLEKLKRLGPRGMQILAHLNDELDNKTKESNSQIAKSIKKKFENVLKSSTNEKNRTEENRKPINPINAYKTETKLESNISNAGTNQSKSERETVSGQSLQSKDIPGSDDGNIDDRSESVKGRLTKSRKKRFRDSEMVDRVKRELSSGDNDEDNVGTEAGVPLVIKDDGIADIRFTRNETSPNDSSKSEFWSSFSSSEERLMECEGLLLNLPLTPNKHCTPTHKGDSVLESNIVEYKIPSNGYYFFIFNSENEVQTNYLKIKFNLEKIIYNVSDAIEYCINKTSSCSLPLSFFSKQKVVLELPYDNNRLNEEFLAISTCEPRTSIYLLCVLAVPILIILFAFQ